MSHPNLTADGSVDFVSFPGRSYTFAFSGDFGGGTLTAYYVQDDSQAAFPGFPITSGSLTTSKAPSNLIRLTLTGATDPDIEVSVTLSADSGNASADEIASEAAARAAADLPFGVSPTAAALVATHSAANTNLSGRAAQAWEWCLTELANGGILDDLADGWCGRVGFNTATAHKTIYNGDGTVRGTVPIGSFGAIFNAAEANTIGFTLPDASVGTTAFDFRYSEAAAEYATPICLSAATGTNVAGRSILDFGGLGTVFNSDGGSAVYSDSIGDTGDAFSVSRFNPLETFCSFSSDNEASPTIKVWVNGLLRVTDTTGNEQSLTELTSLTIGAQRQTGSIYALPHSGSVASWLHFGRVLTDAENVTVAKALRHLDLRDKNLLTHGDSRTAQLSDSGHRTGSWPYQYHRQPGINREYRLCNIARNGVTTTWMASNIVARASHLAVNGTSIKSARFILWTGANDWLADTTGASAWASAQTINTAAKNLGFTTTICTDPEGGAGYTSPQEAERVAFNALVLANLQVFDSIWPLDTLLASPRNIRFYLDNYHLNNYGNGIIAANLAAGGGVPLPQRETFVVLDTARTRTSTTTLSDLTMATATAEGSSSVALSIAAGERATFEITYWLEDAANPQNFKPGISVPAGAVYVLQSIQTSDGGGGIYPYGNTDGNSAALLDTGTGGSVVTMRCIVINSTTPGFVTAQAAQFSSTATAITIKAGSTIRRLN